MTERARPANWIGRSITERCNETTRDIDTLSAREIVAVIAAEDAKVPAAVAAVGDAITAVVDAVVERWERGGRLIYVGAGTSGRPVFSTPRKYSLRSASLRDM